MRCTCCGALVGGDTDVYEIDNAGTLEYVMWDGHAVIVREHDDGGTSVLATECPYGSEPAFLEAIEDFGGTRIESGDGSVDFRFGDADIFKALDRIEI